MIFIEKICGENCVCVCYAWPAHYVARCGDDLYFVFIIFSFVRLLDLCELRKLINIAHCLRLRLFLGSVAVTVVCVVVVVAAASYYVYYFLHAALSLIKHFFPVHSLAM